MRKLLIVVGFMVLMAAAAGAYLYVSGTEYVVEIPQEDIDAALQSRFPVQQRKAGILETSLTNPRLDLDGGSERLYMDLEIQVDLGLAAAGLGQTERGALTVSSGLQYDSQNGRILLDDARMEDLRLEKLPDQYRDPLVEIVNQALAGHVNGLVVYELSSDSYRESLARLFLKDVEISDGKLRAYLGLGP